MNMNLYSKGYYMHYDIIYSSFASRIPLPSMSNSFFRRWWNGFGGFWMIFFRTIIQPKTWRRIFKSWWCFQISSSSFPTFSPSQNKNSPSRFYFLRRQIFSTSENSCHSLHEYCNLLIFKLSPCNDKQKCHVTDVTFAIEWHQWHAKNKHIARGIIDIQRFMTSVQWVQWDWESKLNDICIQLSLGLESESFNH